MSTDEAIPDQINSTINGDDDDGTEYEDRELHIIELMNGCLISQPKSDYREACSCGECDLKITKISRFQEFIKSKLKITLDHINEVYLMEDKCSAIVSAAFWTEWMLYVLHRKLDQLSEESGVLRTPEESRPIIDACEKISETLSKNDLFRESEDVSLDERTWELLDASVVSSEIRSGKFYYKETQVNGSATDLLNEMEDNERIHEIDKKNAKDQLDPLIFKKHIENQIKLVRRLPIEKMQLTIEEIIDKLCPKDVHHREFVHARNYIDNFLMVMIKKSGAFWRGYRKRPSKEHTSNKLDQTLDALICKADLFENGWETKYAPFFDRPFYRSDVKRQRTEKETRSAVTHEE